jgi:hypothetical protein
MNSWAAGLTGPSARQASASRPRGCGPVSAGLSGTPASSIAMSAVDAARAGTASAISNAARQVGQVFGVAVLGALVYAGLPGGSGTGGHPGPAAKAAFIAGLHHAVLVLLGAGALAGLLFTRPGRGPAPGTRR